MTFARSAVALALLGVWACSEPPPAPQAEQVLPYPVPPGLDKPLGDSEDVEFLSCEELTDLDPERPICVHVEDLRLDDLVSQICPNIYLNTSSHVYLPIIRATQKQVGRTPGRTNWDVYDVSGPIVLATYEICLEQEPMDVDRAADGRVQSVSTFADLDYPAQAEVRFTRFSYTIPGEDELRHATLGSPPEAEEEHPPQASEPE